VASTAGRTPTLTQLCRAGIELGVGDKTYSSVDAIASL
jgi:hypothetical protein